MDQFDYATTMQTINNSGWVYVFVLLAYVALAAFLPRRLMWVSLVLLVCVSVLMGWAFLNFLPMHLDTMGGYLTFFDLAAVWSASYPVVGFGAVIFMCWPAWLGAAVLLMAAVIDHQSRRTKDLLRAGDALARIEP